MLQKKKKNNSKDAALLEEKGKLATWLPIILAALTLIVGGGWFQECNKTRKAEKDANSRLVAEYLGYTISTLLKDNKVIYDELRKDYLEPGKDVLESYLAKIRRDGINPHSLMRQRINTMVENNNKVVVLLGNYESYVINSRLREEAAKFRNHAIRYKDRWNAIPDLQAVNGELPIAMAFPQDFPQSVEEEINRRSQ